MLEGDQTLCQINFRNDRTQEQSFYSCMLSLLMSLHIMSLLLCWAYLILHTILSQLGNTNWALLL